MSKFIPSYLKLSKKELDKKITSVLGLMQKCRVCPRKCGVNRLKNERGFCQVGRNPIVSSYNPHLGEERCLVGTRGSGTIFMTWCNLRCVYCQNYKISQMGVGKEITAKKLADIMISLQDQGCHNINFVSPTHQVPQILEALPKAIEKGLKLPLVYNTNAYDSIETLKLLEGIFDIYLPDFKYSDNKIALTYSQAPRYFEIAKAAISEMHRQVGDLIIKSRLENQIPKWKKENQQYLKDIPWGVAIRGLLIRHLVLPENLAGSKKIMKFLSQLSPHTFVNIMDQYHPYFKALNYPQLARRITRQEYQQVAKWAKRYGLWRFAE